MKKEKARTKPVVYQGNSLIEGAFNITLDEIRFLYLALTKIDSSKPQPDGYYTLYPKEFENHFGINPKNTHRQLRDAASSLGKKPVFTYEWSEKKRRIDKVERFWFTSIRYDASEGNSDVTIRFSADVAEYLYELKREFTRLNFEVISKLDTPFSFRLYSWLMSYKELDRCKRNNGLIVTDAIDIDWMKERAGIVSKTYEEFKFFRRDLLEPAIKQINAKTDISISWEPVKRGRTINAIIFSYVVENGEKSSAFAKPLRPRLPRRPQVVAGSDAEGKWARKCIGLMKQYKQDLLAYDEKEKISVADLKKWAAWCSIIGDKDSKKQIEKEVGERSRKG
ncbi:replication initiation protein [Buttiauxella sp. B2]|uniref:replication initiation protein n=1 Tax=Buttiauxella sp. B2 TaxID=2587812 RepID=UPI001120FBB5|nr:replication initiation protein [Buttiauxella sp. B2]TNV16113.1 replication initiation protein [Buttiauxella sp. B2]